MSLSRRTLLAGAGALPLAIRRAAAQATTQGAAHPKLTVRVNQDISVLDPAFRTSPIDGTVLWATMQRLVKFKPGSTDWENDAAEEIRQASDTVVEFRLKPGLTFTDGFGEMTAEDVKFSYERFAVAASDGKESPYKQDWANLDHVEVTGKYTGRIVMRKPTAYLWRIALCDGSGLIVSRAAMEKLGPDARLHPVGTGPYMAASVDPKRGVVLKPNPGWKGAPQKFQQIEVRVVPDPKTAELAFRAGELDFTELTPAIAASLKGAPDTNIVQHPGLRFVWISLNVEKPPLDNPKLRQAIRMGLDVDQILLAGYNGQAPRANALIQPQVLGYWKDAPVHKRDVAGAKQLIAQAGLGAAPRLKLTFLNQPTFQTIALVAQAQLRDIGVTVDLDPRDGGSYWSAGKGDAGKALDMVLMRFNGKLDPNFNTQWFRSDQVGVWNWSRWASKEFDALDDQAAATLDEAKRADIVIQQQKLMEESAAFLWLTYDVDIFASRAWLRPSVMPTGSDWQLADFSPA